MRAVALWMTTLLWLACGRWMRKDLAVGRFPVMKKLHPGRQTRKSVT